MVSEEDLRLSGPLSVDVLSCFSCDFAFDNVFLSFNTVGEGLLEEAPGTRGVDGVRGPVVEIFLPATEVEAVEAVDGMETLDGERLAAGESFVGSSGGTAGRFVLGVGVTLEALDAGRGGIVREEVD